MSSGVRNNQLIGYPESIFNQMGSFVDSRKFSAKLIVYNFQEANNFGIFIFGTVAATTSAGKIKKSLDQHLIVKNRKSWLKNVYLVTIIKGILKRP